MYNPNLIVSYHDIDMDIDIIYIAQPLPVSPLCAVYVKDNVNVFLWVCSSTACPFLWLAGWLWSRAAPQRRALTEPAPQTGDRAALSRAAALFGELYPWQLGSSYQSMRLELYWHARCRRPHRGDGDHSVWRWHTACSASELGCRQHLSLSGISEIQALT